MTIFMENREKNRISFLSRLPDGRFLLTQERLLRRRMVRIFKEQADWLVENIEPLFVKKNTIEGDIDDLLMQMPGKEAIAGAVLVTATAAVGKGGKTTVKKLGLVKYGISFSVKHPDAVRYLKAKHALQLSNYRGNISMTTNKKIKGIVAKGIETGESYGKVAQAIRAQTDAGVFSVARAQLISTNEAREAYEAAKEIPINEFLGKHPDREVEKWWVSVKDSNVTEECMINDSASPIDYRAVFPSGDESPPRFPGCRCSSSHIIKPSLSEGR